jgi:N-succinyldiaminopimelate aminotransferase
MACLVSPGDEVLLIAPYWPLMSNAVRAMGGKPVPVPFIDVASDPASAVATVEAHRTARTVAIYWNTPNNPTGRVIPSAWLGALAHWARDHDLWIVADEVYEHYTYTDTAHQYSRPLAPDRTIAAHSFSKAYGMAGNRCGYLTGPEKVMDAVHKVTRCTFYCVPTAAQLAAAHALAGPGDRWAAEAAAQYAKSGRAAAKRLGVPAPQGSTFLFFDIADHLDTRGLPGFLEDCANDGLLVAPGSSFGPYPTHIRVCFTAVAPAVTARGIEVLASHLGR